MIHIRRTEPGDAAQIQRVFAATGAYSGTLQLPHPSVHMWQQRLENSDTDAVSLVALLDGSIVGCAGLHPEKLRRRSHVAGFGIAVMDSFAGRGVGTALMTELLHMADNWLNLLRIELTVFTDNQQAIRLYQRFGFAIEGTHRAYALRDGVFCDTYAMARLHPSQPLVAITDH